MGLFYVVRVFLRLVAVVFVCVMSAGVFLRYGGSGEIDAVLAERSTLRPAGALLPQRRAVDQMVGAMSPAVGHFGQRVHVRCAFPASASKEAPFGAAGKPVVVLHHGASLNSVTLWHLQTQATQRLDTVVCAFDRPGCGLSPAREAPRGDAEHVVRHDVAAWNDAVAAIAVGDAKRRFGVDAHSAARALRSAGTLHGGHSLGGIYALHAAADCAARAEKKNDNNNNEDGDDVMTMNGGGMAAAGAPAPRLGAPRGLMLLDAAGPGLERHLAPVKDFSRATLQRLDALSVLRHVGVLELLQASGGLAQEWLPLDQRDGDAARVSATFLSRSAGSYDDFAFAPNMLATWPGSGSDDQAAEEEEAAAAAVLAAGPVRAVFCGAAPWLDPPSPTVVEAFTDINTPKLTAYLTERSASSAKTAIIDGTNHLSILSHPRAVDHIINDVSEMIQ